MLLWKSDDRARFRIADVSDVQQMQKTIKSLDHSGYDTRYVACELAANIARAGEQGEIEVNGSEVISEVHTTMGADIAQKIDRARQVIKDKKNGKIMERSGRSGYGFISIIETGWDIGIEDRGQDVVITARRAEAEVSGAAV